MSLSIMSSGFTPVVANGRISFVLKAEYNSIACRDRILFIHPSVCGHLDHVHLLAVVNDAAVDTGVQVAP